MPKEQEKFRAVIDQKETAIFYLKNNHGLVVAITNYGARIVRLQFPDKHKKPTDLVVGFEDVQAYASAKEPYYGAMIGRYANRIAYGKFTLNNTPYTLQTNLPPHHLHGGVKGYQAVVWDVVEHRDAFLKLHYLSKDGEEGFPGNLSITLAFEITDANELILTTSATTDKATVVNFTHHSFFNLNGAGSGTVYNHALQLMSDYYTPVDATLIPTGKLASVENTPFDFRALKTIGKQINEPHEQLLFGNGYDHNFVLKKNKEHEYTHAATAIGDASHIKMEVWTTEPGLQFYSGNFMKGEHTIRGGALDTFRTAFCLEPQHFPDSPNQPNFPSTLLQPNSIFHSSIVYRFGVV